MWLSNLSTEQCGGKKKEQHTAGSSPIPEYGFARRRQ